MGLSVCMCLLCFSVRNPIFFISFSFNKITLTAMAVKLAKITPPSSASHSPERLDSQGSQQALGLSGGPGNIDNADQVEITSLEDIPGAVILRYLGSLSLHLVKETTSLRDAGGLARFVHQFITDTMCIARAQAAARGGNAIVGYRMRQITVMEQPGKNNGQAVISYLGDVVEVARQEVTSPFQESLV